MKEKELTRAHTIQGWMCDVIRYDTYGNDIAEKNETNEYYDEKYMNIHPTQKIRLIAQTFCEREHERHTYANRMGYVLNSVSLRTKFIRSLVKQLHTI